MTSKTIGIFISKSMLLSASFAEDATGETSQPMVVRERDLASSKMTALISTA
jgi:hypothetical protein